MFAKFGFFKPARLVFWFSGLSPQPASAPESAAPVAPTPAPVQPAAVPGVPAAAPALAAAPSPASAPAPAAAPAVAPAAPDSATLEAKRTGIVESLRALVTGDLAKLKDLLGADFTKLGETLKLNEKAVTVDVPANLDFMAKENVAKLAATLKTNWAGKDLTPFVNILKEKTQKEATSDELADTISSMYAAAILYKAKAEFATRFPLFDIGANKDAAVANFQKFNTDNPPGFQFTVKVEFDPVTKLISRAAVNMPAGAETAYEKFKKGSTVIEKTPEAAEAEQNRNNRINAFKNTFLAKVLGFFGLLPMKDGSNGKKEVDYGAILDGSDPIAVFAIGICGGKELLDDPKGFDEMVKSIPDKQRSMVDGLVKNAEGSALSLKKAVEGLEEKGAVAGAPTPESFDNDKFNDWMAGKDSKGNKVEMPKNGFALSRDFSFGKGNKAESLHVDLRGGGEIVIPEIGTLNTKIGGKDENLSAYKDKGQRVIKASEFSDLTIVGTIPKETIFRGNLKIEPKYKQEQPKP